MKNTRLLRQFGARIKSLREAAALTQEQLAEKAAVHRTYMGMIERGEKNLTLTNMAKFADALGVRLSDLFDDE